MAGRTMTAEEKRGYMLTTPMPKLVVSMALPSIASMLVTSIYNLADTYFVSSLGTLATSAVGINASLDNVIMMMGSFLAVGAASYIARLLGAKDDEKAESTMATAFATAVFLGLLLLIFGYIFMEPLVRFLGATDSIVDYSMQYARYILLAAPFMAGNFVLNQCLRAEGSSVLSMVGMVVGSVINIILDPIFIFVFDWGVAGASAATAISKFISFCILVYPYLRRRTLLRLRLRSIRFSRDIVTEVGKMGSSSLFRNLLSITASIILNRMAGAYSESALAAISVVNRITMFLVGACLGFGMGFQPVAGYSWGARRYDRVRESFRFASFAAVIGIAVPAAAIFVFARPIISIFTETDAELIRLGILCLRVQCVATPIHAWVVVVNMLCAGLGKGVGALVLSTTRQGTCFFPLLPLVRPLGVTGIAIVQGLADVLSVVLAVPIAVKLSREVSRLEKENPRPDR